MAAVRAHRLDQLPHQVLGVLEAIGPDVLGEHAERRIQHDHQIAAAARHLLFGLAPLRLHQGDHQASGRAEQAERLPPPAAAVDARQQPGRERLLDEARERAALTPEAVGVEREQGRQQAEQVDVGESVEPHGPLPPQGTARRRVLTSRISSSKRASPTATTAGNASTYCW
jgi:hypothetical protein